MCSLPQEKDSLINHLMASLEEHEIRSRARQLAFQDKIISEIELIKQVLRRLSPEATLATEQAERAQTNGTGVQVGSCMSGTSGTSQPGVLSPPPAPNDTSLSTRLLQATGLDRGGSSLF